jgi:ubiquinone/menaquinone biosynthesis C-methylase UbiE
LSETAVARSILSPFCSGLGLDIGFGGSAIVDSAITFDLPQPYACYQEKHKQILRGDCRNLSFICDNALDYIYSSHVLEDFTYAELVPILTEWRRILRSGGLLITNCPDQQRYESFCKNNSSVTANAAHKEQDFSLETFKQVTNTIGQWETIFEQPEAGAYCWYLVLKKIT